MLAESKTRAQIQLGAIVRQAPVTILAGPSLADPSKTLNSVILRRSFQRRRTYVLACVIALASNFTGPSLRSG